MIRVTHKIAGIVFHTETNTPLPRLQREPFESFTCREADPDVCNYLCKVIPDSTASSSPFKNHQNGRSFEDLLSLDRPASPILSSSIVYDRLTTLPGKTDGLDVRFDDHYVSIRHYSDNHLETYFTEGLGGCSSTSPEYYIAANFREIFSSFLPNFAAILLHSSGVIRKGKAALFLAPNEGGKTTVIRQSNGEPILSGDQIILRKEGDVIVAHGTPLGGITSGPCQAKVGALFMLERSSYFHLEPIAPPDLLHCLWKEHRNNTFFLPKRLKKQAFHILSNACYGVPVFKMRFPKDYVDWDAIDGAMEERVESKQ